MMENKRSILGCEIVNTLTALLNNVERYLLYWACLLTIFHIGIQSNGPLTIFQLALVINLQVDFRLAVCSFPYACVVLASKNKP